MGFIKHYFPGGNTDQGFVNYFNGIIAPWEKSYQVYILKGGPGVGKNTFMKQLGTIAANQGKNVELFHCSGDAESLDAVKIPELKLVMLDGTAPHIIDPLIPGAADRIINLGQYLNESELINNSTAIKELTEENRLHFQQAFCYLAAFGKIAEVTDSIYRRAVNNTKMQSLIQKIVKESFGGIEETGEFQVRRLFVSANSPQGLVDYFGTTLTNEKFIKLIGPKAIASDFLINLIEECRHYKYHCQAFTSPSQAKLTEHLIVNDINLCISTSELLDSDEETTVLNLNECLDLELLNHSGERLEFNAVEAETLHQAGLIEIKNAKKIHDSLEEFYQRNMDFEELNNYIEKFVVEIIGG